MSGPVRIDLPQCNTDPLLLTVATLANVPGPVSLPPSVGPPELIPPNPGHHYMIGGVPLSFPVKAYPSQVAIMAKVIKGLQGAQNCLLESPTGSGKTLALLCSALAWQNMEKEKMYDVENDKASVDCLNQETSAITADQVSTCCNCKQNQTPRKQVAGSKEGNDDFSDDEDRAAFKPPTKKRKGLSKGVHYIEDPSDEMMTPTTDASAKISGACSCKNHADNSSSNDDKSSSWNNFEKSNQAGKVERETSGDNHDEEIDGCSRFRLPRIFYGTRTHKQIEQVVRELRKTIYTGVKMSILASREHMCIHPIGNNYKSKTEMCHDLLDPHQGIGCRFKSNSDNLTCHNDVIRLGCPEPWDIEDLVTLGRKLKACPYFTSRNLMRGAELIFCPYNYLVDPQIQASMQLNLKGDIIIFDEAHNIEDTAREAASYTVNQDDIKAAIEDCKNVIKSGRLSQTYMIIEDFLVKLDGWIDAQDNRLLATEDYDRSSFTWSGTEAIASFEHYGLGLNPFYEFKHATNSAVEDLVTRDTREVKQAKELPAMNGSTKVVLQGISFVLSNMYDNQMIYRNDYRVAIIKSVSRKQFKPRSTASGWMNMNNRQSIDTHWDRTLNFWCQNPSVAMNDLREKTRSIILTSGTLAPVDSFSSELGVTFPIQFEANHIITPSQVWISSISHGPRNMSLNAQWKNAETFDFQDELGQLVLEVCQIVPHGVLCFFPSYKMIEKLQSRWLRTGQWSKLEQCKNVLVEPRRGDELEGVMAEFYRSIEDPDYISASSTIPDWERDGFSCTGALLLAVHRGKVSEGMDFADNQARAVIAVGIPYPNFKDTKVELKRKYNDMHCKSKGLLSGSRWYEIQAYRALNQALGRCIRHRNDWGAILLVDDRFSKGPYYTNGLSKWIRNLLHHHNNWSAMTASLQSFTNSRLNISREADL